MTENPIAPPSQPQHPAHPVPPVHTRLRLLIAEDSVHEFAHLQAVLVHGRLDLAECRQITTPAMLFTALDEGEQSHWDAIICNHQLAAMDAFEALHIVRQHAPNLPFILVADRISNDIAMAAMQAGASDYVQKKINIHRLIPALQRELLAADARHQRERARAVAQRAMEAQINAVNRFRRLAEAIPECVWVFDVAEQRMVYVSSAYERIWGLQVQDLLDNRLDWLRHIHPDDQPRLKQARNQARSGGLDEEFRVVRPDGSLHWLHLITFPIHDTNGFLQSIGGVANDITSFIEQRNQLQASLQEQQHRAELQHCILNALPANVALLDAEGNIVEVNATWEQRANEGNGPHYCVGANYLALCAALSQRQSKEQARETKRFMAELRGILAGGYEPVSRIYPAHTAERQRWFRMDVAPLHTHARRGAVLMNIEITENMLAEQRVLQLSQYDSLTLLPNRLLFRDRLNTALTMARRNGSKVAVCFLDLDRFKAINDSLGHQVGDQLLLEVSKRLKDCVRDCDTVARLGGDEFALVLPELTDQQGSIVVAERVLQSLSAPVSLNDNDFFISASLGLTLFPSDATDADGLLRNADTAMYRAKEMGRNNFQFFTSEMNTNALEAMKLERDLRRALELGEFQLYYQPKVSCDTGRIIGFEALLRWKHPQRGLVSPAEFVPLLEETGLIVPVGEWVLKTACAQARAWADAGLGQLNIAVNVSGKQMHEELCDTVRAALDYSGLPPEYLELELTESYLMRDAENIIATLRQLKAMNISLSVDDFGTGYSSLAYLKRFPLDSLKVDRAFVQDITANAGDVSITRAIITLAHSFNLKVVAEGVETEGQLALLIANQCDIIQGYYFSRPLPADDITAMLREGRRLTLQPGNPGQTQPARPRSVLLAGCEAAVAAIFKTRLGHTDHEFIQINEANQALELLARHPIEVIIAGDHLASMSSIEFMHRVRDLHPQTIRLLLPDALPRAALNEALGNGIASRLIQHPLNPDNLCAHLEEAFRQRDAAEENRQLGQQLAASQHEVHQLKQQLKQLQASPAAATLHSHNLLGLSQDLLYDLPWPVIGIDDNGLIAFANPVADAWFPVQAPLMGNLADTTLPAELTALIAGRPSQPVEFNLDHATCQLHCFALGARSSAQGSLVLLIPQGERL
jgi:diguanylate cyclase (GGDEF)-like protein/PAS domain S-box-containing protein